MKEIAFKDNTITKEQLPLPIVLYPGFYGAFFGFKKEEADSMIFFCSCAKEAIENYLKLRLSKEIIKNANPNRMYILDKAYFPSSVLESLQNANVSQDKNIIDHLNFNNKLCHECNRITPFYRYCHQMYGGVFKQNYGWYINKQAFEWGLEPISDRFLADACPEDLLLLLEDTELQNAKKEYKELVLSPNYLKSADLSKKIQKQHRKVWNIIENEVRRKFGHKNVGEAWTSETILYYIVQNIFPNKTILRHFRPDFLEGLELDIFIKELNLGVEYQGIQHYKPITHWGGKEALEKLRLRDGKKKAICKQLGINLVYFDYSEELSNEIVQKKFTNYAKKD